MKNLFILFLALFLVGCGGGSSTEEIKNSNRVSSEYNYNIIDKDIKGDNINFLEIGCRLSDVTEKNVNIISRGKCKQPFSSKHEASIIDLVTAKDDGYGYTGELPNAIPYFTTLDGNIIDVDLINISNGYSYKMYKDLAYKLDNVKSFVTIAAGNNGNKVTNNLPEAYPNALIVGATKNGKLADYSNRAPVIDVLYDGNIHYLYDDEDYITDGTSYSAPKVSGLVGKLKTLDNNITREELIYLIDKTAKKIDGVEYNSNGYNENGGGFGIFNYFKVKEAILNRTYKRFKIKKWSTCDTDIEVNNLFKITLYTKSNEVNISMNDISYNYKGNGKINIYTFPGYMGMSGKLHIDSNKSVCSIIQEMVE